MPFLYKDKPYADDSARLFFIKTFDFIHFSKPIRIYPKGRECTNEGRMINDFKTYIF